MKSISNFLMLAAFVIAMFVNMIVPLPSHAQTTQTSTNSASNSQTSVTPVYDEESFRKACGEAIEELRAARQLLKSQRVENELQAEMLVLERKISTGLKELRSLDATERATILSAVADLRSALSEKDRVIAAKDRAISALEAANATLKKNRWTFWKASKAAALGVAAGLIVGAVVIKR